MIDKTAELLDCPFCGSPAEDFNPDGDMEGYHMSCRGKFAFSDADASCCTVSTFRYATHDDAVVAWNRRANVAAQSTDAPDAPKTGGEIDMSEIREIALSCGFSLKQQASGPDDLNSYLYDFARQIWNRAKKMAVRTTAPPTPKFDEAEFAKMVERGTKAWAGTPDNWLDLDGATAFNVIARKAVDCAQAGKMMEAWRDAAVLVEREACALICESRGNTQEAINKEYPRNSEEYRSWQHFPRIYRECAYLIRNGKIPIFIENTISKLSEMVVCSICKNKRCPRAGNSEFACTGSNEAGQVGLIE